MSADPAIIGTCGIPYPFYETRVVDDQGQDCPPDTPGDLFCRAPQGYFRYVGRFKDMIKRTGENISAVEVETVMRQFSDIDEVAVIPVKHRVRGEEVKALITLRPGRDATALDYAKLHAHCAEHLASFKIPRYIEIVTAFDHTPSKKIKKNELVAGNSLTGNWDYTIPGPVETGNDKQT